MLYSYHVSNWRIEYRFGVGGQRSSTGGHRVCHYRWVISAQGSRIAELYNEHGLVIIKRGGAAENKTNGEKNAAIKTKKRDNTREGPRVPTKVAANSLMRLVATISSNQAFPRSANQIRVQESRDYPREKTPSQFSQVLVLPLSPSYLTYTFHCCRVWGSSSPSDITWTSLISTVRRLSTSLRNG